MLPWKHMRVKMLRIHESRPHMASQARDPTEGNPTLSLPGHAESARRRFGERWIQPIPLAHRIAGLPFERHSSVIRASFERRSGDERVTSE